MYLMICKVSKICKRQIYYIIMANLDSSMHSLNSSTSKHRYSFSQSRRFQDSLRPLCDSIYDISSSMSKKATMLGYGQKMLPLQGKDNIPGVGKYYIESSINPVKNRGQSISCGVSRQMMEFGDPLNNVKKHLQNVPSPSSYQLKHLIQAKGPTFQSRYKDYNFQKKIHEPGPGAYNHDQLGSRNYYALSKNRHVGISRVAVSSRLDPIEKMKNLVGPGDYQLADEINNKGKYLLGMHSNTNSCIFGNAQRKGFVHKDVALFPGPGQYNSFSSFS